VRREAIEEAGGFAGLERVLGEDIELARRISAAGYGVRVAPAVARSLNVGRSWHEAALRYARWLGVIRAQRPHLLASYPLLFCATPLILAGCALVANGAPALALGAAVIALSARLVAAISARLLAGLQFSLRASMADSVRADALLAHAFARALVSRTVIWRGRRLTVDRRGALWEGA
jgi:ceramide glucosyltransferase